MRIEIREFPAPPPCWHGGGAGEYSEDCRPCREQRVAMVEIEAGVFPDLSIEISRHDGKGRTSVYMAPRDSRSRDLSFNPVIRLIEAELIIRCMQDSGSTVRVPIRSRLGMQALVYGKKRVVAPIITTAIASAWSATASLYEKVDDLIDRSNVDVSSKDRDLLLGFSFDLHAARRRP